MCHYIELDDTTGPTGENFRLALRRYVGNFKGRKEVMITTGDPEDGAHKIEYKPGDVVKHNEQLYRCKVKHRPDHTTKYVPDSNQDTKYWEWIIGNKDLKLPSISELCTKLHNIRLKAPQGSDSDGQAKYWGDVLISTIGNGDAIHHFETGNNNEVYAQIRVEHITNKAEYEQTGKSIIPFSSTGADRTVSLGHYIKFFSPDTKRTH